eukprot:6979608-Pyramimonas_sp.AAC.1
MKHPPTASQRRLDVYVVMCPMAVLRPATAQAPQTLNLIQGLKRKASPCTYPGLETESKPLVSKPLFSGHETESKPLVSKPLFSDAEPYPGLETESKPL